MFGRYEYALSTKLYPTKIRNHVSKSSIHISKRIYVFCFTRSLISRKSIWWIESDIFSKPDLSCVWGTGKKNTVLHWQRREKNRYNFYENFFWKKKHYQSTLFWGALVIIFSMKWFFIFWKCLVAVIKTNFETGFTLC